MRDSIKEATLNAILDEVEMKSECGVLPPNTAGTFEEILRKHLVIVELSAPAHDSIGWDGSC